MIIKDIIDKTIVYVNKYQSVFVVKKNSYGLSYGFINIGHKFLSDFAMDSAIKITLTLIEILLTISLIFLFPILLFLCPIVICTLDMLQAKAMT